MLWVTERLCEHVWPDWGLEDSDAALRNEDTHKVLGRRHHDHTRVLEYNSQGIPAYLRVEIRESEKFGFVIIASKELRDQD